MTDNIWRFLIVDDQQATETEEFVQGDRVLDPPNVIAVYKCQRFKEALQILNEQRFDLVLLDLKDDSIVLDDDDSKPMPGEIVFEQIRNARFIPVVFYTAFPEKVRFQENPYVKVVTRGQQRELRQAIRNIFSTKLPQLIRHLETEQKEYMWNQIATNWTNPVSEYDQTDLSYLLARRLASTLERNSIRRFLVGQTALGPGENDQKIHPVEMYIYPPTDNDYLAGDIFMQRVTENKVEEFRYWILLTPSCDFAQGNAEKILLARCIPLEAFQEFSDVKEYWTECKKATEEKSGKEPKRTPVKVLAQLLKDNYEIQPERFKFLPGTFFLPNLVVDFQSLMQIPLADITGFERITSLDNPFAEAILAKFSRYYGRLGTPDLDVNFVIERLSKKWEKEQSK